MKSKPQSKNPLNVRASVLHRSSPPLEAPAPWLGTAQVTTKAGHILGGNLQLPTEFFLISEYSPPFRTTTVSES